MCTTLLLDHPLKFLNVPTNQRTFQSVLQAMAFVACEYMDDLVDDAENQVTYAKLIESSLIQQCLLQSKLHLDENFLLSVAHLLLKSFLKTEGNSQLKNPLECFRKLVESDPNQYLELKTMMHQSTELVA